ncbi:MAG: hypothetical protein KF825_13185 [Ferruginibacter sp.]|nr:hypothetical protein [Bacteroidota bacterium]MBX2919489.1 hypothetical protein [Ferruginibacter sp.]MBX2935192.1 hypothetical protein [Ferruginibacter sp.]MCB0709814.1 hypothetical protein [Chitinophagaceae bacterium]MCC7379826.1 hypothetical protein [Chitinophagaceae bacterium]
MKIIFNLLFFMLTFTASAQINRGGLTERDTKGLPGKWTGTMVFTADKEQVTYKSVLNITDMKDSMMFNFIHVGPDATMDTVSYAMRIYDDGNKLEFDSSIYDIMAVRRKGIRLVIIAEREGVDKYRSADFQITLTIGPGYLNIVKGIRYDDMTEYFIRYRSVFTKSL